MAGLKFLLIFFAVCSLSWFVFGAPIPTAAKPVPFSGTLLGSGIFAELYADAQNVRQTFKGIKHNHET